MKNKVQKDEKHRIFTGSWFLVIAPVIIAFLIIWTKTGSETAIDKKWLIEFLIYMVGGSIFYYFASLVPIKVIIARSEKKREAGKSDKPSLANFIFSDFFKNVTVTYNIYNSSGSFQESKTQEIPAILNLLNLPIYLIVYFIVLFVKASFIPYWAILSFFHNYVFLWIFPKKSGYTI